VASSRIIVDECLITKSEGGLQLPREHIHIHNRQETTATTAAVK